MRLSSLRAVAYGIKEEKRDLSLRKDFVQAKIYHADRVEDLDSRLGLLTPGYFIVNRSSNICDDEFTF
jgi:hypothetical protein